MLLTGFEPFGGRPRNPSGDIAEALGRDPRLRAAGVVTAILPVHRTRAPAALLRLLRRHHPETLVLTGLAAGRKAISLERIAVNCWRRAGDAGVGVAIDRHGPDGLFATLPAAACLRALRRGGAPASMSESAGTFCCNLVLYRALSWAALGELPGGGTPPTRIGFIHLPATAESLPPGSAEICLPRKAMEAGVRAACLLLAGSRGVRPRHRTR